MKDTRQPLRLSTQPLFRFSPMKQTRSFRSTDPTTTTVTITTQGPPAQPQRSGRACVI